MAVNKKKLNSEIQQALFSDTERFEMFFAAHWKKIAMAAIVAAIAVAAFFYLSGMAKRAERRAECAFADARTVGDLEKVLADYPSAPGTPMARLKLANLYADGKLYDKALAEIKKVADDDDADPTLRVSATVAEAYMLEMNNKIEAAAKLFESLAKRTSLPAARRAEAACNAGRLFIRLDNAPAAKSALENGARIPVANAETAFWSGRAKSLLIALECGEFGVKPAPAKK